MGEANAGRYGNRRLGAAAVPLANLERRNRRRLCLRHRYGSGRVLGQNLLLIGSLQAPEQESCLSTGVRTVNGSDHDPIAVAYPREIPDHDEHRTDAYPKKPLAPYNGQREQRADMKQVAPDCDDSSISKLGFVQRRLI